MTVYSTRGDSIRCETLGNGSEGGHQIAMHRAVLNSLRGVMHILLSIGRFGRRVSRWWFRSTSSLIRERCHFHSQSMEGSWGECFERTICGPRTIESSVSSDTKSSTEAAQRKRSGAKRFPSAAGNRCVSKGPCIEPVPTSAECSRL